MTDTRASDDPISRLEHTQDLHEATEAPLEKVGQCSNGFASDVAAQKAVVGFYFPLD